MDNLKLWYVSDQNGPIDTMMLVRAESRESAERVVAAEIAKQALRPLSPRAHFEELVGAGAEEVLIFDQRDCSYPLASERITEPPPTPENTGA